MSVKQGRKLISDKNHSCWQHMPYLYEATYQIWNQFIHREPRSLQKNFGWTEWWREKVIFTIHLSSALWVKGLKINILTYSTNVSWFCWLSVSCMYNKFRNNNKHLFIKSHISSSIGCPSCWKQKVYWIIEVCSYNYSKKKLIAMFFKYDFRLANDGWIALK